MQPTEQRSESELGCCGPRVWLSLLSLTVLLLLILSLSLPYFITSSAFTARS
jgi:hypothetical protein